MLNTAPISVQPLALSGLGKAARAHAEWFAAAGVAIALWVYRVPIATEFASDRWSAEAFFGAVFDWSSIQAALLFGVYAFFLSRSEPFLQAIAGTPAFRELRNYLLRTLRLSMALTLCSLPMVIATPTIDRSGGGWGYMLAAGFAVVTTFTFFSFLKVIRVFGKIDRRS